MSDNGTINTTEESNDSDSRTIVALLALATVLASPFTVIFLFLTFYLFSYVKVRRIVILIFSAPYFIFAAIFWKFVTDLYIKSWTVTVPSMFKGELHPFPGIFEALGQQFLLGMPLGILAGLAYASYRWWTRPRWQEFTFKRTPWELFRYKKTVEKIENNEETPTNGMTLGIDHIGHRVIQTNNEAAANTFVVGGSGSGKTTTLMSRVRDSIKNGEGVAIIDLKGGTDVPEIAAMFAEREGRKFQHWLIHDLTKPYTGPAPEGNAYYDPLSQGDATRRADMILELRDWTNADYFKNMSQSYLLMLFTVLIANPRTDISTLEDTIDLMDPKELQRRSIPLAGNPKFSSVLKSIDQLNDEKISSDVRNNLASNRAVLQTYRQSAAGEWLTLDPTGKNNISLESAARNGDVVVFSLDSSSYPQLSSALANLIIQDLKTISSSLRANRAEKPFQIIIDEFSAIGSDNIIGLINKSRDAQMPTTIATQTLADLMVANPAVKDQIMGIIGSFIIHRANIENDAKVYAGLTGTTIRKRFRQTVEHKQSLLGGIGAGIGAGKGAVEDVEEWVVTPSEIQRLNVGEMVYLNAPTHRIERVQCIPEKKALAFAPHQRVPEPVVNSTDALLAGTNPFDVAIHSSTPSSTGNPLTLEKADEAPAYVERAQESPEATPSSYVPANIDVLKKVFNDPLMLPSAVKQSPTPVAQTTPAAPATTNIPKRPSNLPGKPATPPVPAAAIPSTPTAVSKPPSPFKKAAPVKSIPTAQPTRPAKKTPRHVAEVTNDTPGSSRAKDEFDF